MDKENLNKLYLSDIHIIDLQHIIDTANIVIQERKDFRKLYLKEQIEKAMYKAFFYGKSELAEKLRKQDRMNSTAFYTFRTLDDMAEDGIISKEEYDFCK